LLGLPRAILTSKKTKDVEVGDGSCEQLGAMRQAGRSERG